MQRLLAWKGGENTIFTYCESENAHETSNKRHFYPLFTLRRIHTTGELTVGLILRVPIEEPNTQKMD